MAIYPLFGLLNQDTINVITNITPKVIPIWEILHQSIFEEG